MTEARGPESAAGASSADTPPLERPSPREAEPVPAAQTVRSASDAAPPVPVLDSAATIQEDHSSNRTLAHTSQREAQASSPFDPGRRIGPYEVVRPLGKGAMGVVLLAKHTELGREVALKVMNQAATGSDPDAVERFRRESEAVARLEHPNVVRMYDRGEADGLHYYAMEYVKGTGLDAVIRRERMPYVEAARIVAQCAHAIDFAHGLGILHRDLKPANILLDEKGRAKVTDFGLARIDQKATLTQEGTLVGTPLYLAPEVAKGERASRRSDIYSLGATLYELATQKPPYPSRDARTVLLKILNEAPIPPTVADPRIPAPLVQILARSMARDPGERYANARELAVDLEKFTQGHRVARGGGRGAFQESGAARAWRQGALPLVAAFALLGVVALLIVQDQKRKSAERERERLQRELGKLKSGGGGSTEASGELARLDEQARRLAGDRDVRARLALRALADDAGDSLAKKTFDDAVGRARESRDDPTTAITMYRSALAILPHRYDVHVELARVLEASDSEAAETELSLVVLAPDAKPEVALDARAERARYYRTLATPAADRLASEDYAAVLAGSWGDEERRRALLADDALALAEVGDSAASEKLLERLPVDLAGDDLARASLARAWNLKGKGAAAPTVDAEVAKARNAGSSDEVRKLVDAFPH